MEISDEFLDEHEQNKLMENGPKSPEMPPIPNILRKTLEKVFDEQQFEIKRLLEFLKEIAASRSSQQHKIERFIKKWESTPYKVSREMFIVQFAGTWAPQFSSRSEVKNQRPWKEFAQSYDATFNDFDIDSQKRPDYQPLNFKDLLRLTFFQELYETFGSKIVGYIFGKCALFFESVEGLYVMIAHPLGTIYKKFSKYDGASQKRMRKKNSKTVQSIKPTIPAIIYPHCNPFMLEDNIIPQESDQAAESNDTKRKHSDSSNKVDDAEPPTKRQKPNTDEGALAKLSSLSIAHSAPRWIRPKLEDLQKIINYRENMIKAYSATTASRPASRIQSASSAQTVTELNFVGIFKDEEFIPKNNKIVWKQTMNLSANTQLPSDWDGLQIDRNSIFLDGNNQTVKINTFKISETLAKQLKIRLKPKARCRKSKNKSDPAINEESSKCNDLQIAILGNPSSDNQNSERKVLESCENANGPNLKSFSSLVKLPIASCLYNNSAWSKWPSSHCSSEAASLAKEGNKVEAMRTIIASILGKPTCSQPTYQHLITVISENWTSSTDDFDDFKIALSKIIESHVKFHDMHKLLKNCLKYWQRKEWKKQEKKMTSPNLPTVKIKKKTVEVEKSGDKCLSQPVLIDLTQSTPTNFSSGGQSCFEISPGCELGAEQLKRPPLVGNSCPADIDSTRKCTSRKIIPVSCIQTLSRKIIPATESIVRKPNQNRDCRQKTADRRHWLVRKSSGNSSKAKPLGSLKRVVSYNCVMQTLKQIFHLLNLEKLLGTRRNVRGFFKFVRKALILGGTRSSLNLAELMAMVRPEETPFAVIVCGDKLATETFVGKLVMWLFNDYILELLRMSFYITECGFTRLQLQFYLRESWVSATHGMKKHLRKIDALKPIASHSQSAPSTNAYLRFVPKSNHNLRSLVMKKKSALSIKNDDIKKFKLLLHYIDSKINKCQMYMTTGVTYEWRRFLSEWNSISCPKLYYLRMDIRDAYPSVSTSKLRDILIESIRDFGKKFVMKQFAVFKASGKRVRRESVFDEAFPNNWHSGIHMRSCIVMDLERDKAINAWRTIEEIIAHIMASNVVQVGKKTYEFNYGLPQGWSPSPILCSIYYGYIDATLYRSYFETRGRLFLRIVDDYLFISPSAKEVSNLINLMKIGCEKHEIKLNQDKSETNIFVNSKAGLPLSNCEKVVFCGWNFCIICGHVSRDYSKYRDQDFCSTISFHIPEKVVSPEDFIRLRGTMIMPTRLKPILLDPQINCPVRILLTVFEASILLGFRFYALCRVIYPNLNALKEECRKKNIMSSVQLCCSRMATFVIQSIENIFDGDIQFLCKSNCCGCEIRNNSKLAVPMPDLNKQVLANIKFREKCLTFKSLMYVSLLGLRLKLLRHSEVFQVQIIPEINSLLKELRGVLGKEYCETMRTIVGSKIPNSIDQILI